MKKLITLIVALIIAELGNAQITFQKAYGYGATNGQTQANCVKQTTDGGYILVGTIVELDHTVYLVKTNTYGDISWTKTFNNSIQTDGYSVQQTNDGGYIIAGDVAIDYSGNHNVYLIKTDSSGILLWSRNFGATQDYAVGYSIHQTNDGGYIIAGISGGAFGVGGMDMYVIKTDSDGDSLWTKVYGGIGTADGANSIEQTKDGGYIILGWTESFGVGEADVYMIKTDSIGNTLWSKTYGGALNDRGLDVHQTQDSGYIIAGNTESFGKVKGNIYVIKTDSYGDTLWSKIYEGNYASIAYSIQQTLDGGYVVAGEIYSGSYGNDVILIKTNIFGDTLWTKGYGGANPYDTYDMGFSVAQTTDGGYAIAGKTNSLDSGHTRLYLIKMDSLGTSGCHEYVTSTTATSALTSITNPTTIISNHNIIVGIPATVIDSGGTVSYPCLFSGIEEIEPDSKITIYPNPAVNELSINGFIFKLKTEITIYSAMGEQIYSEEFSSGEIKLDVRNISSGIYFVKVFDGTKYHCKKFIVEHD